MGPVITTGITGMGPAPFLFGEVESFDSCLIQLPRNENTSLTLVDPNGQDTRQLWKLCEFVLPEEPRCKENVGFWKNTMFLEKTQKLYPNPFPNKNLTLRDEFDSIHHQKSTQFHASFWFGVFGGNLSDRESRQHSLETLF